MNSGAEVTVALAVWMIHDKPRPPMPAQAALVFAYDWPDLPVLRPRCNGCGRFVRHRHLIDHQDTEHAGWLEQWNENLKRAGVVQ